MYLGQRNTLGVWWLRHIPVWSPGVASRRADSTPAHFWMPACLYFRRLDTRWPPPEGVTSDKNDRPLILSDKNRGNVDSTCHQPVIYDVVTVNNCYLWYFPDANLFMPTHSLHSKVIWFTSVLCQHQSSGIWFNYVQSDKNDRPLILSDKNRGNVDNTCHQPVIYDVTVNNCYLWYFPDGDLFMSTHSLHS